MDITQYKGKSIFQADISVGNSHRSAYLDSVHTFIEKKLAESQEKRDAFMENIVSEQATYREKYIAMIGQPVMPYPDFVPRARKEYLGRDGFGDIYSLQIETMPDFWFYGIFMVPQSIEKAPLIIAQHGGGSTPEICSDFLGESNYGFFTKRALERSMAVFAPQLLLWKFDMDTGEPETDIPLAFDRSKLDAHLRQLGLSITGLEVFCIRRSLDYLSSLPYIDENRIGMMGVSYGGYFALHTAAADTRIKSVYAGAVFNDRTKIAFNDWKYKDGANTFLDAEVAALCAPRRLQIDVGKNDPVFDYASSPEESRRAKRYYEKFHACSNFRFTLWEGGHKFDESGEGFDFFFETI